jgi:hypothetical protein
MRPVLIGLAVVASIATSLIGPSGLGGVPTVAQCGGPMEDDCDENLRGEDPQDVDEQYERLPEDPEEEAEFALRVQRNAWADAHLAAEQAVATWWRNPITYPDRDQISDTEWREYRVGVLWEQNPNGIPGDAMYPVNGFGSSAETLDGIPEFVRYECDPNYGDAQSGGCVPGERDYDCGKLRSWGIASIPVIGEDWMLLDDDGDGLGCEPIVAVLAAPTPMPIAETDNPCDGLVGTLGCFLFGP